MITETRKAIIRLISDYMDKTLSEWCLIYYEEWFVDFKYHKSWRKRVRDIVWYYIFREFEGSDIRATNWALLYLERYWYRENEKPFYQIIGHYDITAVFKYINSKFYNYSNSKWYLSDNIKVDCIRNNFIEYIPNKPLHLFNEKEDDDLYNLLLKLK